jgi:hypothetical protein
MFIKVERYDGRQNYWLYDDIAKVSVSLRLSKGEMRENEIHDGMMFDFPDCGCGPKEGCSDCKEYIVLICRMRDGSEYSIAFDTIAYVLNDEGKTIEKIVANYKD